MKEKRYFISDAAKELEVESHVLRYWEEELNLDIPRNEMGHRYYREEELEMLKCVKELKARGFQLKTIRQILNELQEGKGQAVDTLKAIREEEWKEEQAGKIKEEQKEETEETEHSEKVVPIRRDTYQEAVPIRKEGYQEPVPVHEQKMQEFEDIMRKIVGHAMRENSHVIGSELGEQVSQRVIKEMDYLMRLQEEREEKHFQNLDNMIRQYQRGKKETAAAKMTIKPAKKKRKSPFFRKRKKRTI